TGLTAGVTYYYCAIASNSVGTRFGTVQSFTTPALPTVSTAAVTLVTGTTAQFNGSATPRGGATTAWFRYGTSSPGTCNDTFGIRTPATGGSALGNGTSAVTYSEAVSGLIPGTTYYVCAVAQNPVGTHWGTVRSFTTPSAPSVTTGTASSVTASSAVLAGS